MQNFYITTPIYYVNDKPHIGHAYTSLAADVLVRFLKLDGKTVQFTTGTDEHGQKILDSAKAQNTPVREFVDNISGNFKNLAKVMDFEYSDFIRTTENRHQKTVEFLWEKLKEKGYIYLGEYSGWYAKRDEAFYSQDELIDGKAPTGAPVELMKEESYFFRLSSFGEKLLKFYKDNPDFIVPKTKFNEALSFIKGGLHDLSISRLNLDWGIRVPGDANHTIYVWLDALTNYLSSVDFINQSSQQYKDFWQNGRVIHIIGKDILRFHAVYWPAFLMAAGLPLPTTILTHGWWTNEGEKISKSLGNVIDPVKLVDDFNKDAIRYFLMREVPFGSDGNFSASALKERVNADLANNIGNLVQRTLMLVVKNCDSKVPECNILDELAEFSYTSADTFKKNVMAFKFSNAIEVIIDVSSKANEYINTHLPWSLAKTDRKKMNCVLYNLLEAIRCIGIMLQPFIPESSSKILDSIMISNNRRDFTNLSQDFRIQCGTDIKKPTPIFTRYE